MEVWWCRVCFTFITEYRLLLFNYWFSLLTPAETCVIPLLNMRMCFMLFRCWFVISLFSEPKSLSFSSVLRSVFKVSSLSSTQNSLTSSSPPNKATVIWQIRGHLTSWLMIDTCGIGKNRYICALGVCSLSPLMLTIWNYNTDTVCLTTELQISLPNISLFHLQKPKHRIGCCSCHSDWVTGLSTLLNIITSLVCLEARHQLSCDCGFCPSMHLFSLRSHTKAEQTSGRDRNINVNMTSNCVMNQSKRCSTSV